MKTKTNSIETEDAVILIVPHRGWRRFVYYGACLVALITDGSFIGADPPYDIEIMDRSTGRTVHRERSYFGGEASVAAQQFASEIERSGLSDFIFKRSHGWRSDS